MMSENNQLMQIENIHNHIISVRGVQVILDSDLAKLYDVETRTLNQAVKRNINRFPPEFMFQLTRNELEEINARILISQIVTSKENRGGRRKLPYVFTEQGVAMLAGILRSDIAIEVSIRIINTFIYMRRFLLQNANLFNRIKNVEKKQIATDIKQIEAEKKIDTILDALQSGEINPKQGIFYDGQVFDAYVFISNLVKSANKSILLIDNFVDESVLQLFTKRKEAVSVVIYTKNITRILKQDLEKHNSQYPIIKLSEFTKAHDRFLIIDETFVYHIGASLKDLGKKWFAFSKIDMEAVEMITMLGGESIDSGE
jgi:hypothetical protein